MIIHPEKRDKERLLENNTLQFLYHNYSESNFKNNVNIIKKKLILRQLDINFSHREKKEENPNSNSEDNSE